MRKNHEALFSEKYLKEFLEVSRQVKYTTETFGEGVDYTKLASDWRKISAKNNTNKTNGFNTVTNFKYLAKNENDFEKIIIRELSIVGLQDTIENKNFHSPRIFEKYNALRNDYIKNIPTPLHDEEILIKAKQFLDWMVGMPWFKDLDGSQTIDLSLNNRINNFAFKDYLTKDADRIFPILVSLFSNEKPRYNAYLLIALKDLEFITEDTLSANQSQLYNTLKASFDIIGSRQSLNNNLKKRFALTENDKREISSLKTKIINSYTPAKN